jgi:hypothetical protein
MMRSGFEGFEYLSFPVRRSRTVWLLLREERYRVVTAVGRRLQAALPNSVQHAAVRHTRRPRRIYRC